MNRRSFTKGVIGAGIATMIPNIVLGGVERDELESVGSLFGNSFDFIPNGDTETVEVVLMGKPMKGNPFDSVGMIVQNNTASVVYISDIEGMVRDAEGTPLTTVWNATIAPAVLQPGEYSIVDVTLDGNIDDSETAVMELNPVWEVLESVREPMFANVSVEEAVSTDNRSIIGTITNTSGESYQHSVWEVVAICFDGDGNIVSTGSTLEAATPTFIDGGSQTFSAVFPEEEPTEKFLVAAVMSLWG